MPQAATTRASNSKDPVRSTGTTVMTSTERAWFRALARRRCRDPARRLIACGPAMGSLIKKRRKRMRKKKHKKLLKKTRWQRRQQGK